MTNILYMLMTFLRVLADNPGRLIPLLACACVITLIIAVMTDALMRGRSTQNKKTAPDKTSAALR
jgi:hypothetical protein